MSDPRQAGDALTSEYVVEQHLNRGNVCDVYSVWSLTRDCLCIAKTVRPDAPQPARQGERLRREGQYLAALTHPHLVRGYETVSATDGPILIMETLTGTTLSRLIEANAPQGLNPGDVAQLGRQLCSALYYLHARGLVHLDLKPSNIVCAAGTAVVLDIGLAQPPGPCDAGTGTIQYMAPEQVRGDVVDMAADIWGVGGVLYRALTGHRPLSRSSTLRSADQRPDFTRLRLGDASPAFQSLIVDCLAPEATARPDLETVSRGLEQVIAADTSV